MILPILKYGSKVLRKQAFDIGGDDSPDEWAKNMVATLKNADGIGLAGLQVGLLKNIFIIDTSPQEDKGIEIIEKTYCNPFIIQYSENSGYYNEGCLSIPGINEDVLRPDKIEVRYMDEHLNWHEEVLDGLIARIFQHEFDHLQGILFIDRLNLLRKKLIKNKLRKISRSKY